MFFHFMSLPYGKSREKSFDFSQITPMFANEREYTEVIISRKLRKRGVAIKRGELNPAPLTFLSCHEIKSIEIEIYQKIIFLTQESPFLPST
jgi:hypothetical protein